MAGVQALNFDSPDEKRTPDKTRVDVVRTGGATAGSPQRQRARPTTELGVVSQDLPRL